MVWVKRTKVTIVSTLGLILLYSLLTLRSDTRHSAKDTALPMRSYVVDTPACRIPKLDPYDESIRDLIVHVGKVTCRGKPSVTYQQGAFLHINQTSVQSLYNSSLDHCYYQKILRFEISDGFLYHEKKVKFTSKVEMKDEFVRVECVSKTKDVIYTNFHAFVVPKSEKVQTPKLKHNDHRASPKEVFNVLLVELDSVSRPNFIRQFPKTRDYLLNELEGVELQGYTKVADNTLVNVVPMLTGKFLEELPWNESMSDQPFDKYNFIWRNFSENGYVTMTAEDHPTIQSFNFGKRGFYNQPTDHYYRPFALAMEFEPELWTNFHHCVGNRREIDILLQYTFDFAKVYRSRPYFGFTFMTRLTHDDANEAGKADEPVVKFLQDLHNNKLLNNTVVVLLSDHGMRYGYIRNTYVGKFEERMPYLAVVLPKRFKEKYPEHVKNLHTNSKRLSTPFDIYETLKDLIYFKDQVRTVGKNARGISLFTEIPLDRSCDSAAILPHWCTCLERERMSVTSLTSIQAAGVVVNTLNIMTSKYRNLCATLTLNKIMNVDKLLPNLKVLTFEKSFNDVINRTVVYGEKKESVVLLQVTVVTKPGNGVFEATVKFDDRHNVMTVLEGISRVNMYGSQSKCIHDFVMKKYCYCT